MFNQKIDFNEELHKYYVNGKELISVSGVIKKISNDFDKIKNDVARGVACSRLKKAGRKLTKRSIEQATRVVLKEWKDSNERAIFDGNIAHDFAEKFAYNRLLEPESDLCLGVIEFFTFNNYEVLGVENMVHSLKYPIAGTFDLLLKDKDGKVVLADWKTNKDLFKNYKGKTLNGPLNSMLDSPINKYTFQLNLYRYMLLELGFVVDELKLIWLRTDELLFEGTPYENHTIFDIELWSKEKIENILNQIFNNDNT
jgi:ATP-dependent exoDNAse (exonuclease V) beta subunit